ncbi:MAG: GGDEF domain-containing protein, partial [Sulfurimonas sp.]|nr:GGDEF domain-containing protein [Sulfurimonas sp.]
MLLPQTKEREYRFKLALRMVLPAFALVFALIIHTLNTTPKLLNTSFYIEAILVLIFSIYFIFYLIYKGFDTKITDNISKTFTREYIYDYLKKEIK